jgi:predicted transposase/invertase (TIGR01784 family)
MKTYEEQKAFITKLNVIDDIFFQKMAEDIEVCEEILRIILDKPKLKVIKCEVQRFLRNTGAHSVILDLLCEDEDHSLINVEVQKADNDDHQKRVRFNRSNIDTIFTEKGIGYNELPDVYMVFISNFDIFNGNRSIYHVNRVVDEMGIIVDNGTHEIYVNTAVDDKSDVAELMQYFKKSVGEHKNFMKLCNRVKYFKESQKGVSVMCQVVEEYAKSYAEEYMKNYAEEYTKRYIEENEKKLKTTAINLLKKGVSVDIVAESIPDLSRELIEELSKNISENN